MPTSTPLAADWRLCRFRELDVVELQHIYTARQQVFVVEQACAYLDADGVDEQAWHLAAWTPSQRLPLAYARLVEPGVKYAEPSIGRVVVSAEWRGRGLGRELMQQGIARCTEAWPGQGIRISAQAHLDRFYGSLGFEPVGQPYNEDDIPHLEMFRRAP